MNYLNTHRRVLIAIAVLASGGMACLAWLEGIDLRLDVVVGEDTHAAILTLLFFVLPVVGFPINMFLILLGVRFEPGTALLIMFSGMALHQAVSFPAGNTVLKPVIERILARKRMALPQFRETGFVAPSLLFMAVPGLTYTMKNYILALSGIPFRYFFFISWMVQSVMGIPVVLAGGVLGDRQYLFFIPIFLIAGVIYAARYWMKKAFRRRKGNDRR